MEIKRHHPNHPGKVYLVGAGPGDPDLLTVKALKVLEHCDVIVYDDLVPKGILATFRAEKVFAGKRKGKHHKEQDEINSLLVTYARQGKTVVRFKGGDPMLFAHGGEEIEYLELNSIECEVIPGISAGLAAASISKIPLTYRNLSSSVTLFTGHTEQIPKLAVGGTLVMYMAASKLGLIAASLVNKGWNPETPVALLHNVSLPGGSERITTLSAISHPDFKAVSPLIVIVGEVVAHKSRVGKRDVWKRIVGSRHGVSLTECPG